ncbi:hypothetical protein [Anaeromyxobacter sp. SG17]|uniref:hypothetical protein n=1 Tax=Anaeromyxobacter sp. SG17 TaxID=2925405 RepID=UPI001F594743|nr:hypothetical protein [Anaeromyxobacter sp. SG17]
MRAYHEAGHAVIAMLRGFGVTRLTVSRRGRIGGACEFFFSAPRRGGSAGAAKRVARAAGAVALAGSVAQDRAALERGYLSVDLRSGLPFPLFAPGAEEDRRVALRFAAQLHSGGAARHAFLRRMRASAERQLEDPRVWAAVERLAHRLVRARVLTGDRAARTVVRAIAAASSPLPSRGAHLPQPGGFAPPLPCHPARLASDRQGSTNPLPRRSRQRGPPVSRAAPPPWRPKLGP